MLNNGLDDNLARLSLLRLIAAGSSISFDSAAGGPQAVASGSAFAVSETGSASCSNSTNSANNYLKRGDQTEEAQAAMTFGLLTE